MKKILLIIVALIAVFGAFTIINGNKTNPTEINQESTSVKAEPTQAGAKEEITTVTLTNAGFSPKDIVAKTGTRVVWINKSGAAATVNSDDHPTHRLYTFLNLGEFADGSSVQAVFDKAGKYTYHNHYNASQMGSVTVE